MAKTGNHGIIIPRDVEMLRALYWGRRLSLTEIAAIFDVGHKTVSRVFQELGIPTRPRRTKGQSRNIQCIECGHPVVKILHRNNGSLYGRRCAEHLRAYKARWARNASTTPARKAQIKKSNARAYYHGLLNPTGELQWLSQSKVMLRNVRRMLTRLEASKSRSGESTPETSSHR